MQLARPTSSLILNYNQFVCICQKYHNKQAALNNGAAPTKLQENFNEANQHHQYQARSDLMQPVAHPTIK